MDYREFLSNVKGSGGFASSDEAEAVVASVLMAVAEVLPQRDVGNVTANLPPEIAVYLRPTHPEPDPYFDSHLFLGWVVSSFDVSGGVDKTSGGLDLYSAYSGDEAIRRCRCVFTALKSLMDDRQRETLLSCLPEEVGGWFLSA
jgi:uncharacterized protein (DUF2267 family)